MHTPMMWHGAVSNSCRADDVTAPRWPIMSQGTSMIVSHLLKTRHRMELLSHLLQQI